jgi:hypothetical protein
MGKYALKDSSQIIGAIVEAYLVLHPPTGGVQLGETISTAYRGDRGKTGYDQWRYLL